MWLSKRSREMKLEEVLTESGAALDYEIGETRDRIAAALMSGLDSRNRTLGVIEHSARVAEVSDRLAVRLGISEQGRRDLSAAAQLHELGMIAVPPELLGSSERLGAAGVARIRAQAQVSAEIARATQTPRTVRLIEEQYTDFVDLRQRYTADDEDMLLAAILRVVDAFDAVTFPRPYQKDVPDAARLEGILEGQGTRYHPFIVDSLCDLDISTPES